MHTKPIHSAAIHSAVVGDQAAPHRVVFLHGLFGRGKNFTTIAKALAPEAQSLLVDLPNHGASAHTDHFDYCEIADTVATHLRKGFAASGPVDVVGHSMGGKVAMVLALRHPDLVRRLVVIDIAPTAAKNSAQARGEFGHYLDALASIDLSTLKKRTDAHEALHALIPNDTVRGFLLQNLVHSGGHYAWQPNLPMLRQNLDRIMGFIDAGDAHFAGAVLWIRGEKSNYITDADVPEMRRLFSKVVRITVHGAGHWVHSQKPAETVAALREFLLQ